MYIQPEVDAAPRQPETLQDATVQYGPFYVSDRPLLTAYPVLARLHDHLNDRDYVSSETGEERKRRTGSANMRNFTPAYREAWDRVFLSGAHFGYSLADAPDYEQQLTSTILSVTTGSQAAQNEAERLGEEITGYVERSKYFVSASEQCVDNVEEDVLAGTDSEYEFVKLLAGLKPRPEGTGLAWEPRNILACMLVLGRSKLPHKLLEQVKAGTFDSRIAVDLIRYATDENTPADNGVAKIKDLVAFADAYYPLPRDESVSRLAQTLMLWPRDPANSFNNAQKSLVLGLENSIRWAESADGAGTYELTDVFNPNVEDNFRENLKRYLALKQGPNPKPKDALISPLQTLQVRSELRKKRGRQPTVRVSNALGATAISRENQRTREWDMVRLTTGGKVNETETRQTIQSITGEYLSEYGYKSESAVATILNDVLGTLRSLDMSQGLVSGLKKMRNMNIAVDTGSTATPMSVFEYKPAEVKGLSLPAARAKKLRILFCFLEENKLGLIKILERDDVADYLKNHSLGSRARNS